MSVFNPGETIKTDFGDNIRILEYLASGGQGDVYKVEYAGSVMALKWYKNMGSDPDAFYNNLKTNVNKGSPDKAFLWPAAVTERKDGSFGYVMNLRPSGYYELSEFMLGKVGFPSFKAATDVCIKIVSAFRILHNKGFSYQDLNDGNFFINPKTGDVLICDNDNVAPNGKNLGVIGKPRYMAPEIVKHETLPNTQTDRFSLAVILFLILCMNHPLEGKKSLIPCLTPADAEKLYGTEALFICDPDNDANAPVANIHSNVIARWKYLPDYVRDAFTKAFSQDAIKEPGKRLRELDWLKVLVRFRSDIVRCTSCGNEVFVKNAASTACDGCGKNVPVEHAIQLSDYSVAATKGSRIFRCQLGTCNDKDALNPIACVVAKPDNPDVLGIRNMTDNTIKAITPSGKEKQVKPGEIVPLKAGIIIEVENSKIKLL